MYCAFPRFTDLVNVHPSYMCLSDTITLVYRNRQTSVLAFVKLLNRSASPVAISMANSTTTVMKVMTPGPAGRSSPEGSQVSPQICTCIKKNTLKHMAYIISSSVKSMSDCVVC